MIEQHGKVTAIITSAAYANSEICAEFGRLPPTFLPLGHNRLYSLQVRRLREVADRIVMSLPDDYEVNAWEKKELSDLGVELVYSNPHLSLGESINRVIVSSRALDHIIILHGDTFFEGDLPSTTDWVAVATADTEYNWGAVDAKGAFSMRNETRRLAQDKTVLTGVFSLSSGFQFLQALSSSENDFLSALNAYTKIIPLQHHYFDSWLDFGHLQSFYKSRASVTTARSFNSVKIDANSVLKTGDNQDKIKAEAAWFQSIPQQLRLHVPPFLGVEVSETSTQAYRIGYEFNPTLHELAIFGSLGPDSWKTIFSKCFSFFSQCRKFTEDATLVDSITSLTLGKTEERLDRLKNDPILKVDKEWLFAGQRTPSLTVIAEHTAKYIVSAHQKLPGVMHGDFCFPNVFYDFRQGLIKVIDPRGGVKSGEYSAYGDLTYDLAKLNHSIEGYDLILAGRYMLSGFDERDITFALSKDGSALWLNEVSREFDLEGVRLSSPLIKAMTIQLFLSMLPLHADRPDRQKAFLANALRLYCQLDTMRGY